MISVYLIFKWDDEKWIHLNMKLLRQKKKASVNSWIKDCSIHDPRALVCPPLPYRLTELRSFAPFPRFRNALQIFFFFKSHINYMPIHWMCWYFQPFSTIFVPPLPRTPSTRLSHCKTVTHLAALSYRHGASCHGCGKGANCHSASLLHVHTTAAWANVRFHCPAACCTVHLFVCLVPCSLCVRTRVRARTHTHAHIQNRQPLVFILLWSGSSSLSWGWAL